MATASAAARALDNELKQQIDSSYESIEERCFSAALICLEGHFTDSPPMGPLTSAKVTNIISRTLDKTHTFKEVR